MQAYLHFGKAGEPQQTISVEHKDAPLWRHERNVPYTMSGYGARIPSAIMIKWAGRWRRVYVMNYGNLGSCYIGKSWDRRIASVDFHN